MRPWPRLDDTAGIYLQMMIYAVPFSLAALFAISLTSSVHAGSISTPLDEPVSTSDDSYAHPDFQVVALVFRPGIDSFFVCLSPAGNVAGADQDEDVCAQKGEFLGVVTASPEH